ncbi:MAG: hypothetical protein JWO45_1342, partial [Spartobacteria bacterium]|nr:hypothetical protein [Spartobacteria bacterium]
AGSDYVEPPAWLVEGLLAASPGQDRSPLIEALTPLLATNNVIALPDYLRQKPALLDAPGQLLYRAYALALLQLLVEAPDGSARLAGYIENLSCASTDPLLDLMASFPAMANSSNMEARWKSKIAGLASARDYLLLSFAESDRRLDELLATRFPATAAAAKTLGVEDLLRNKISALHAAELKKLSRSFTLLAAAATPVMRPFVLEYQQILELLAADKRKGLASRLGRLKTTRARIVKRMNDVDDYMNWCEATKSSTASGAFANYLSAAHKGADSQPRRRDPLSVYLDSLEGQF